jgi:hypothetical protein
VLCAIILAISLILSMFRPTFEGSSIPKKRKEEVKK